jgi:hypothetical protein
MPSGFRPFISPSGATAPVIGQTADIGASNDHVFVAVFISGTATALLEASMDEVNWLTVATITASTAYQLDSRVPYYRVRVTAVSGTVTAQYGPTEGRNREMGNVAAPIQTSGGPQ